MLVSEGQSSAKRRRRAQSSSSVRLEKARTPPVVNSRHDVRPYADLKHHEAIPDDHEWQAQCIVGERQTPSGLEYEVNVQKMLWLPRAMLDTKLVRKYRAVRTRWSSRLQKAGRSGETAPVVAVADEGASALGRSTVWAHLAVSLLWAEELSFGESSLPCSLS